MSEFVDYRDVTEIYKHPDADNLKILRVEGFVVCVANDFEVEVGMPVIHFPTDICINPKMTDDLGVTKYLRDCRYKNEGEKVPCRVVAARLRGIPSQGFVIHTKDCPANRYNLDDYYGIWKYEPPELPPSVSGDVARAEHPDFPKYTKIQRINYHPYAWVPNLPVRMTEKIHGMNVRLGVVKVDGEWQFMVGSHNCILREYTQEGQRNAIWELLDENVMNLLNGTCDGEHSVVIYGERYGKGVQDLDYGQGTPSLRVFDLMIDGVYQDWDIVRAICEQYKVPLVPLLFEGGFSWSMVENLTSGNTTIINPTLCQSKFKGREGIVITPLVETTSPVLGGGRLIAKSINVDYEARRSGTEYH